LWTGDAAANDGSVSQTAIVSYMRRPRSCVPMPAISRSQKPCTSSSLAPQSNAPVASSVNPSIEQFVP
jgi:hypothetical protein